MLEVAQRRGGKMALVGAETGRAQFGDGNRDTPRAMGGGKDGG